MRFLRRLDLFWLGAGGFLLLFNVNEMISYATAKTPRWLGGPYSLVGISFGALVAVGIIFLLGVKPEPEATEPPTEAKKQA